MPQPVLVVVTSNALLPTDEHVLRILGDLRMLDAAAIWRDVRTQTAEVGT
jgi:hypothetical protein